MLARVLQGTVYMARCLPIRPARERMHTGVRFLSEIKVTREMGSLKRLFPSCCKDSGEWLISELAKLRSIWVKGEIPKKWCELIAEPITREVIGSVVKVQRN